MPGPRTLLFVDDHLDLAENLADIFRGAGYETDISGSAEAALERMQAGDIAALVTDYRLPGRNGAELIAELRRRGLRIPAVVMSAYTDDATIEEALHAGAVQVLAKPVMITRLLELIDALGPAEGLVLVVDDNEPLAENIGEALRQRGYEAAICTTATEAMARARLPRAAILDLRLPDGSGMVVAEHLTRRDPQLPVLFVTAHRDDLDAELGRSPAGVQTLPKPIDMGQLLDWVARALGNAPAQRPRR